MVLVVVGGVGIAGAIEGIYTARDPSVPPAPVGTTAALLHDRRRAVRWPRDPD